MKGKLTNDEFITDADLRSFDMLMYGREVPSEKPPRPKKVREIQNKKLYRAHKEEKEKAMPIIYNEESATLAAIAIVSVRLPFDLVSTSTPSERARRLTGWGIFSRVIRLMLGNKFDLARIHKAISYENKPSLELLELIFNDDSCPYRYDQLQKYL
jgi:hypothetical protein